MTAKYEELILDSFVWGIDWNLSGCCLLLIFAIINHWVKPKNQIGSFLEQIVQSHLWIGSTVNWKELAQQLCPVTVVFELMAFVGYSEYQQIMSYISVCSLNGFRTLLI